MKLFDDFEVVKFYQENLLLVTRSNFIYYIYNLETKNWRKHKDAGNTHINVCNYDEVGRIELANAMNGLFPKKETDFTRLCRPNQLSCGDMLSLLREDYPKYMSDRGIRYVVDCFLSKSNILHASYLKLKELFDSYLSHYKNIDDVFVAIKQLSFDIIGRDIFKDEIGIVDGHDGSSYFWIMPVRVIDYDDTDVYDNVAEMKSNEISIEECDVSRYLYQFLKKHLDNGLKANNHREHYSWTDENGEKQTSYTSGFEWYFTHNFYTFDSVRNILNDIHDKIAEYNSEGLSEDNAKIVDFYNRFIYRMEYMMRVGEENGYDLISFMGP